MGARGLLRTFDLPISSDYTLVYAMGFGIWPFFWVVFLISGLISGYSTYLSGNQIGLEGGRIGRMWGIS